MTPKKSEWSQIFPRNVKIFRRAPNKMIQMNFEPADAVLFYKITSLPHDLTPSELRALNMLIFFSELKCTQCDFNSHCTLDIKLCLNPCLGYFSVSKTPQWEHLAWVTRRNMLMLMPIKLQLSLGFSFIPMIMIKKKSSSLFCTAALV